MNTIEYWKRIKEDKSNGRLIFVHAPKCGGSYTRNILRDLNIIYKGHTQATDKEGLEDITFMIVRYPVSRLESLLNAQLMNDRPRHTWPERLKDICERPDVSLNEIVSELTDEELSYIGGHRYNTLEFWGKNINIFITIDQLHSLLSFFGYNYEPEKYPYPVPTRGCTKANISEKTRGTFNEITKQRIVKVRKFSDEMKFFNKVIKSSS